MNLESQVCSFEYAKKLKELNVKQNSFFSWQLSIDPGIYKLFPNEPFFPNSNWRENNKKTPPDYGCSAFTVAELMELLPHRVTIKDNENYNSFMLRIEKFIWCKDPAKIILNYAYSVNYYCDTTSQELDWIFVSLTHNKTDENTANALAKMMIYLYENGLISNE